ncbi:MAG: RHS repeat-associated core domain-containing protein [Phycisphaerales bacterium JB060]
MIRNCGPEVSAALLTPCGLDGYGGASDVDSVLMRRTFLSTGTPQTEAERWYVLQNWRQDVVAIIDEAAVQRERVFYSPYGRVFGMVAGDTGFDGDYGAGDSSAISGWATAGDPYRAYADVDLDGDIDGTDATYSTNVGMGWDELSRDGSTIGYAGYVQDDFIPELSHVRHRVYKSDLGRWVQRDPAGYVDGGNLYEYVMSQPVEMRDAMGLASGVGSGSGCGGSVGVDSCGAVAFGPMLPYNPDPGGVTPCSLTAHSHTKCIECCADRHEDTESLWQCAQQCDRKWNRYQPSTEDEDLCKNWHVIETFRGTEWADTLPPCPCNIGVPPQNPVERMWKDPSEADQRYHPGAKWCMRTKGLPYREEGQQCCYDASGDLITSGQGAGTPDLWSPNEPIDLERHLHYDVRPFEACRRAGLLDLYFEVRPPNNALGCPDNPS